MAQERAEAALLAAEKAERSVDEKAEMEPAPVAEEPPQVGEPPVEETKEPNESIITANEPERTVEEPAGEKSGPVPIWVIRWLTSPSVVFLVVGASTFMLVLYVVLGTDDEAGQGGSPAKVTKKRTKSQKVN